MSNWKRAVTIFHAVSAGVQLALAVSAAHAGFGWAVLLCSLFCAFSFTCAVKVSK